MSKQPLLAARMSCWPVLYDIEHGVQHGTDLILPNGTTVQTEKRAPESGSCYAIQHPESVAAPLSPALASKGYTTTPYDLIAGDYPVMLGTGQYGLNHWFYLAEDGILCGITIKADGSLTSAPMPRFIRTVSGFESAFVPTTIARASSVSSDMQAKPPRGILDVQNNGAEAILHGNVEGGVQYSMGHVSSIYHIKLTGPSTAVVMDASSKTLCYNRYPNAQSYPDNWLHSGETINLAYSPQSTDISKAVIGGTQEFWRDRIASARFKADGTVEIIRLYTIETSSTTGAYERTPGYPGSAYEAFIGGASMTSTMRFELRGDELIDSFSITKQSSTTTEWILGGEVIYTTTHMLITHSELGTLSNFTSTYGQAKEDAWLLSVGYKGSDQLGDATGYAYFLVDQLLADGQYWADYYASVQRITNKVYSLGTVGSFIVSNYGYPPVFARWVHGVYGINGQKYELSGGLAKYMTYVPTHLGYATWGMAYEGEELNATQHPVIFELRYFGAAESGNAYCFV